MRTPHIVCSRRSFFALSTASAAGFVARESNKNPPNKKQNQNATNAANSGIPFPEHKSLNIAKINIGEHLAG
ncbi:MAG: hypothetical protein PF689_00085 [Deltaproteobacteria bacterium]|jgi:hypothetical protein|nr:hypothetical protein [Deltaproteobacteria bacterium]